MFCLLKATHTVVYGSGRCRAGLQCCDQCLTVDVNTWPLLGLPSLPCRAAYGGPVLDGMVFYQPTDVTDSFKAAAERYMQHRFEPKLKVREGQAGTQQTGLAGLATGVGLGGSAASRRGGGMLSAWLWHGGGMVAAWQRHAVEMVAARWSHNVGMVSAR